MNDIPAQVNLDDVAQRIHDAIHYGYPREAQRILNDLVKTVANHCDPASTRAQPAGTKTETFRSGVTLHHVRS